MEKSKSPLSGSEHTGYGPDVRELLNNLEYPNDASLYTLERSPDCVPSHNASSNNTPVPRTPNEGAELSGYSRGRKQRSFVYHEQANTNSQIDESDLSSISNPGTAHKQLSFIPAEGTTIDLQNSNNIKIIQENYDGTSPLLKSSEGPGIFPKIHAATVDIPVLACDESPLASFDNGGFEESVGSASHTGRSQMKHTPSNMSEMVKAYRNDETNSPEFQSSNERKKKFVSKTMCETARRNLEKEINRDVDEEEFGKLKTQLIQEQIRSGNLDAQNSEMRAELEVYVNKREELIFAFNEQKNHCNELEEHIALLEQQLKDPSQVVLLHNKALENAKTEITQLRTGLQAREKENTKLRQAINNLEREQRAQGNATFKQIKELCAEIQKYKLLLTAIKRQMHELQGNSNAYQAMAQSSHAQFEAQAKELRGLANKLQAEKESLLTSVKEHKQTIEQERKAKQILENNIAKLKEKCEQQFKELNEVKVEIEQFGGHGTNKSTKADYADQVMQIKDQYSKKVQSVNEELLRMKEILEKKECQIAEYESKLKAMDDPEIDSGLEALRQILQLDKSEDVQSRIEELLAEAEEGKILKEQQENMESELKESQQLIAKLNAELQHKAPIQQEQLAKQSEKSNSLAIMNEELAKTNERLKESKDAMQIQLKNISETLKIKDKEISLLTKSRDVAESNEKAARAEMEKLASTCHTLTSFIDNVSNTFQLSFVEPFQCSITQSMAEEEKLDKINNYLQNIKEQAEGIHSKHLETISSLQKQVKGAQTELPRTGDSTKMQASESGKLRELLGEERAHSTAILEQMKEMHRVELEALGASKNAVTSQLQEKVKTLAEKLARKKEKMAKKLGEVEELEKKLENALMENEKLRAEVKELKSSCVETSKMHIQIDEGNIDKLEEVISTMKDDLSSKDELIAKLRTSLEQPPAGEQEDNKTRQRLEESEKALKIAQQRLLQSYEENNEKINALKDKLKEYKDRKQVLESKNKELVAECKHLHELLKDSNVGGSRENMMPNKQTDLTLQSITLPIISKNSECKSPNINANSSIMKSSFSFANQDQAEVIKALDTLIDGGRTAGDSPLEMQLMERVDKVRRRAEESCLKEVERRQAKCQRVLGKSGTSSLQGSIEQSLTESDKAMEEGAQKRMLMGSKRVHESEELNFNKTKESITSLKGRKGRYKADHESVNCEELYCGTGRTVSFGCPEVEADFEENSSVNLIIEEYKKKLEQQKNEELSVKSKELEKEYRDKEKAYKESIESMNQLKTASIEDLMALKEQEIKAKLNIENMKAIDEKKNELTRQYMENREKLLKEFGELKQKLHQEVEQKVQALEEEHQALLTDQEQIRKELEKDYLEKANAMKERLEEEYKVKIGNIKQEMLYVAKESEKEHRAKIEELELQKESRMKEFEDAVKKLKEENELKCEQLKKKLEKDHSIKAAQIQRKYKEADERANKLKAEYDELSKNVQEEQEAAIENAVKKYKEEIKLQREKHKAEIRNIKDSHKNDMIKKDIEADRELKKLKAAHMEEVEHLKRSGTDIKPIGTPRV